MRDMHIPAGTLFIGRVHRHGHVCQLLEGSVIHISETGQREVQAPFEMFTTPGTQVVLYTLTDILGRTVHPNPHAIRDTDALEADIFEPVDALKQLGGRLRYQEMIAQSGFDPQRLEAITQDEADQIPFPTDAPVEVGPSKIEGKGLIARYALTVGERIAPARIHGKRTPAGRYTNHDFSPNARMTRLDNGDIDLVAIKYIPKGDEVTVDYREAIKVGLQ